MPVTKNEATVEDHDVDVAPAPVQKAKAPQPQPQPGAKAQARTANIDGTVARVANIDPVEEQAELLARDICKSQGRDPELLVTHTVPEVIGTPGGNAYLTRDADLRPMWSCYVDVARSTLKLNAKPTV